MATNVFKQFEALLPRRPLEIATITTLDGDQAIVTLPGGGTLRVRGAGGFSVSDPVFVREGFIEGAAPDLEPVNIEI